MQLIKRSKIIGTLQLHLVRLYAAGFNLTVESECVFKTSSYWVLHLSSCI